MPLTLGCDPELVCKINGKFQPASDFFKMNSSMGLDGCNYVAEIRPGYSESPVDLTAKIRYILEYGHQKESDLEFYCGHYVEGYPIGGHIHCSTLPTQQIINALTTNLEALSNCIDDLEQKRKRSHTGYGKAGSCKFKPYGFEYRTPGSWLLSPSTALATLTLAKLSIIGLKEDDLDFAKLKFRKTSCNYLKNLRNHLKTIPEDCQEGLNQMESLIKNKWDWNKDILPAWGLAA